VAKGILHVPSFEGGVILAGSGDVQAATELKACDNLDIGVRGQLQSAATAIPFLVLKDQQAVPVAIARAYGVAGARFGKADAQAVCVGLGKKLGGALDRYFFCQMGIESSVAGASQAQQTWLITDIAGADVVPPVLAFNAVNYTQDPQITAAAFSYVSGAGASHPNLQQRLLFINLGARYPHLSPRDMPGLFVMYWDGGGYGYWPIGLFDALGTGPLGEFNTGNKASQLFFRGIAAYNNHLFGFGFDNSEAASGEGPNRLMFSNVGNPLKWGNDNIAAPGANRFFTDSDAITVGGSGEVITALCASRARLWIGTSRGLHYLAGYGRDSFITDGTTPVAKAMDVVGPNALIEGPDGVLYGVSSKGLWSYRGGLVPAYAASTDRSRADLRQAAHLRRHEPRLFRFHGRGVGNSRFVRHRSHLAQVRQEEPAGVDGDSRCERGGWIRRRQRHDHHQVSHALWRLHAADRARQSLDAWLRLRHGHNVGRPSDHPTVWRRSNYSGLRHRRTTRGTSRPLRPVRAVWPRRPRRLPGDVYRLQLARRRSAADRVHRSANHRRHFARHDHCDHRGRGACCASGQRYVARHFRHRSESWQRHCRRDHSREQQLRPEAVEGIVE
jgi:hypothetical protein